MKVIASPIQAVKILLHYQLDGWRVYINDKLAIAFTAEKALVQSKNDALEWIPLDIKTNIIVTKHRVGLNLFRPGEIDYKPEKTVTKYQQEETDWLLDFLYTGE